MNLLLGGLLCAFAAGRAEGPAVFTEHEGVTLVELEVLVTDDRGQPVRGLQKESFELRIDGEPVEIRNFFAVEDSRPLSPAPSPRETLGGPPPSIPAEQLVPLQLVFFVDQSNLESSQRKRLLGRLRELVLRHARQQASYMLVTHERELELRQAMTPTLYQLLESIEELESTRAGMDRLLVERRRLRQDLERIPLEGGASYSEVKAVGGRSIEEEAALGEAPDMPARWATEANILLPQIHAYSQQRYESVERSIASLRRVVEMIAGLPGRKVILYLGGGLPMRAGEELFYGFAARVATLSDVGGQVSPEAEASRYDASPLLRELTARANGAGVSIYSIDAAPSLATTLGSAAEGATAFRSPAVASIGDSNRQDSLAYLSSTTAGRAALGDAAVDDTLESIYRDASDHYSLGFVAQDLPSPDSNKRREIEVATRDGRYRLRYPRSWRPRSIEDEMAALALAALFASETRNELEVSLSADRPSSPADEEWTVPLTVEVPLQRLVLLPGRESHHAELRIALVVADGRGRSSEVVHRVCPLQIPNAEILVALGRTMGCGLRLRMRSGRQTVAVAVRDVLANQEATLRVDIEVGPELGAVGDAD